MQAYKPRKVPVTSPIFLLFLCRVCGKKCTQNFIQKTLTLKRENNIYTGLEEILRESRQRLVHQCQ